MYNLDIPPWWYIQVYKLDTVCHLCSVQSDVIIVRERERYQIYISQEYHDQVSINSVATRCSAHFLNTYKQSTTN